jgi:hypothetical protein
MDRSKLVLGLETLDGRSCKGVGICEEVCVLRQKTPIIATVIAVANAISRMLKRSTTISEACRSTTRHMSCHFGRGRSQGPKVRI